MTCVRIAGNSAGNGNSSVCGCDPPRAAKRRMRTSVQQQKPRPLVPAHHGLDALAIEPSRCFHGFRAADRRYVRGERSDMMSMKPPSRCATAAITRANRELWGATTIVGCAARHNASHAAASLAKLACVNSSPCTASNLLCRVSHLRRRAACIFRNDADRQLRAQPRRQSLPAVTASSDPLLSAAPLSSACVEYEESIPSFRSDPFDELARNLVCAHVLLDPRRPLLLRQAHRNVAANHSLRAPPSSPFAAPA